MDEFTFGVLCAGLGGALVGILVGIGISTDIRKDKPPRDTKPGKKRE